MAENVQKRRKLTHASSQQKRLSEEKAPEKLKLKESSRPTRGKELNFF